MMTKKERRLRVLELSLGLALVTLVILGAVLNHDQQALSGKLLRLQVLAEDDSQEEQKLKLYVRDKVLEVAGPLTGESGDAAEARRALEARLPEIEAAASRALSEMGSTHAVKAELIRAYFPTRDYDTFSLPAGQYETLRVTIGSGSGHNWWCVVFPPLCLASASEFYDVAKKELSEDDIKLISGGNYQIKFKLIEIYEILRKKLGY